MVPELLLAPLTVYLTLCVMYGKKIIFRFLDTGHRATWEYFLFFLWRSSVYVGFGVAGNCLKDILTWNH